MPNEIETTPTANAVPFLPINPPNGKRRRKYNSTEMAAINVFKDAYLNTETVAARKHILVAKIIPALVTVWTNAGSLPTTPQQKLSAMKTLQEFVYNNWRVTKTRKYARAHTVTILQVVLKKFPKDVEMEMAASLGLDAPDPEHDDWFSRRWPACKAVFDRLSTEKQDNLKRLQEKMKTQGLSPQLQEKLAEKNWVKRFDRLAQQNYGELGVLSLSVVVYVDPSGKLATAVHDKIATNMNVHVQSFHDGNKEAVTALQLLVFDYVKTLKAMLGSVQTGGINQKATSGAVVRCDEDEYPVLPEVAVLNSCNKRDAAELLADYLNKHYKLALGGTDRQIPYKRLVHRTADFIQSKYLPRGFTLKRPHDMRMEQIIQFVSHVTARQQDHGMKDAFCFSHVEFKTGHLREAHYPHDIDSDGAAVNEARPQPRPRKKRAMKTAQMNNTERTQMQGVVQFDNAGVSPPPPEALGTTSTPAAQMPPQDTTYTIASHTEMQALNGMMPSGSCPLLLNGPNDPGMPQYAIPTTLYAQLATMPQPLPAQQMVSNPTLPITPRETPGVDESSGRTCSTSKRKEPPKRVKATRQGTGLTANAPDDGAAPRRSTRSTTQAEMTAAAGNKAKGKQRA